MALNSPYRVGKGATIQLPVEGKHIAARITFPPNVGRREVELVIRNHLGVNHLD